jgi:hypothetical protein
MCSKKHSALLFELPVTLAAVFCLIIGERAEANANALSPAEKTVIKQVQAGEIADLAKSGISGVFLHQLLTGGLAGVKVHPHGVQIKNATITDVLDLRGSEVAFDVVLQDCIFEGSVSCSMTHFKRGVFLEGCQFFGGVDFGYAEISSSLSAKKAIFKGGDQPSLFHNLRVTGDASFIEAVFENTANFAFINVGGSFWVDGAQFQKNDQKCEDDSTKCSFNGDSFVIKGHAFMRNVTFAGGVYLGYANIGGSVFLKEKTTFKGEVEFGFANIGGNLWADGTKFEKVSRNSEDVGLNGDSMTVGGSVLMRGATCAGIADFHRARVGSDFEVSNTTFAVPPDFLALRIGDTAYFDKASIEGQAKLKAMTYQSIFAGSGDELLDLIKDHSEYSADVYANLADVYRRHGEIDDANDVYIAGRRRERTQLWREHPWTNVFKYSSNCLQDIVTGYGHRLSRALIFAAAFVAIGSWVFHREEEMVVKDDKDAERYKGRYRPFWYSLSLLLPIIDLEDARIWTPRTERRNARFYLRLHVLLGYLLVPIGLAALTGIIK